MRRSTDTLTVRVYPERVTGLGFDPPQRSVLRTFNAPGACVFVTRTSRFYRKDTLIVLYIGADADVARALETVLGVRIAGSE